MLIQRSTQIGQQQQKLKQAPNANLLQTMSLMPLTLTELYQKVHDEIAINPALELVPERQCPTCQRKLSDSGPCPVCVLPVSNEAIVFVSSKDDFYFTPSDDYYDQRENEIPEEHIDLPAFVFRQIASDLPKEDHPIAEHILSNLNEDGLLTVPLMEIALYHHVPLSKVKNTLNLIQRCEPLGIGSPTPQEALLVQLDVISERLSLPQNFTNLAKKVIREGLQILSHHNYKELSRLLEIPEQNAHTIAQFIADNLYPFPARQYWGEGFSRDTLHEEVFHSPDIIISQPDNDPEGPLLVEIVSPYPGTLRIAESFTSKTAKSTRESLGDWKFYYDRANLFLKCIQQRMNTMVRMMEIIAQKQRAFILKGDAYLVPMTQASISKALKVHESTISRAVCGKTVQLPNKRIIPLKRFFERNLPVRTAMKELIAHEEKPLSDAELARRLKELGYDIARRTVTKYRAKEGILPAYMRAKLKKFAPQ